MIELSTNVASACVASLSYRADRIYYEVLYFRFILATKWVEHSKFEACSWRIYVFLCLFVSGLAKDVKSWDHI